MEREAEPVDRNVRKLSNGLSSAIQIARLPKYQANERGHTVHENVRTMQVEVSGETVMQRKRTARACDQCRRRKSRCDGQMNCSACQAIGLECSFGHQVKQTRGPTYVAHLEKRVAELEQQLRRADRASEPGIEDSMSMTKASPTTSLATNDSMETNQLPLPSSSLRLGHYDTGSSSIESKSINTLATIDAQDQEHDDYDQMALDHPNYISGRLDTVTSEPRGKPFGLDLLRQLSNFTNQSQSLRRFSGVESSLRLVEALNNSQTWSNTHQDYSRPYLPHKEETFRLVGIAFEEAFHLWPFIDQAQADATIYHLYCTGSFGEELRDDDDLALMYMLLALGQRFDMTNGIGGTDGRKTHGMSYFNAAKAIVPLTECDRSLSALQTALCMALYCKSASDMALTHAHITAVAGAALRMGLHEETAFFAQEENVIRRRVWSTIQVLDTYVCISLGLSHALPLPYTQREDTFPPLPSESSTDLASANANAELATILTKAINSVYHGSAAIRPIGAGPYSVSQLAMKEASDELGMWTRTCPVLAQDPENMTRSQLFLECARSYADILLYSPFIHHMTLSETSISSPQRTYAHKCLEAAFHAVHIAELLHKQLYLNEAYFFTIDVLAFAATVLLVVEVGCAESELTAKVRHSGRSAKELLLELSLHSTTAAECWKALAVYDAAATADESSSGHHQSTRKASNGDYVISNKSYGSNEHRATAPKRPGPVMHFDSGIDMAHEMN